MAGAATMGDNLVDELVAVADELRDELHAAFGVRQFRTYICKRVWSGDRRGEGDVLYIDRTELLPAPKVDMGGLHQKLDDVGMDEDGDVTLHEVSLTYTEDELTGQPLGNNEECFYELADGMGQSIASRYFVLADRPVPDRDNEIGWRVKLKHADFEPGGGL